MFFLNIKYKFLKIKKNQNLSFFIKKIYIFEIKFIKDKFDLLNKILKLKVILRSRRP